MALAFSPLLVPWLRDASVTVAADGMNGVVGVAGSYGALLVERAGSWRELELTGSRADADVRVNVDTDKAATGRCQ